MPSMRSRPQGGTHWTWAISPRVSRRRLVGLHRDEPLFRRAENDRLLTSPAMRVRVIQAAVAQQTTGFLQSLHDLGVGFQHMLSGEFRDRVRKSSCIIHRRQDFESFARRGLRIMIKNQEVVFHPMAWSDMHATRSLFQSDKIPEQDRREAGRYRAFEFPSLRIPPCLFSARTYSR